jgi:A/G-specific adenine glycosylase
MKEISSFQIQYFQNSLLAWYGKNGRKFPWRRKKYSQYNRVISEVLLQRTQANTVAKFFPDFIKTFPSWKILSRATEEELGEYLKPIGLWRRRSASLIKLAKAMNDRKGVFPRNREEIEELPGVGQYIANAILMFCFGERQPLLDTNMSRVVERFFGPRNLADIRYDPYLQVLTKRVVDSTEAAKLNWAILDLAALVCKAQTPRCFECPLRNHCQYFQNAQKNAS